MAKFSEETLNGWRKPPSDTEEGKLTNAESRIRQAITKSEELKVYVRIVALVCLLQVGVEVEGVSPLAGIYP